MTKYKAHAYGSYMILLLFIQIKLGLELDFTKTCFLLVSKKISS